MIGVEGKQAQVHYRRAAAEVAEALSADLSWHADAACATVPTSTAHAMVSATTAADADVLGWRCEGCPVAMLCLDAGLQTRASGLWGGFVLRDGEEVTA